jgi:hypothetical protein
MWGVRCHIQRDARNSATQFLGRIFFTRRSGFNKQRSFTGHGVARKLNSLNFFQIQTRKQKTT